MIQTVDEVALDAFVLTGDTVPPTMANQLADVCRLLFPAGFPAIVTLWNHEFWTRHFLGTLGLLATALSSAQQPGIATEPTPTGAKDRQRTSGLSGVLWRSLREAVCGTDQV